MTVAAEVQTIADESGVALSVRGGRLVIRGSSDAVARVKAMARECKEELITRLLNVPNIELTHQTTRDLIFHDQETMQDTVIPAGTHCRHFGQPRAALREGVPFDQSHALRNLQSGYTLVWLHGVLRGVAFKDVEPLPEVNQEKEPS